MPRPKTCFRDEKLDITLLQHGKNDFSVRYGLQLKEKLTYSEAATKLGTCIMHALACDSKLDNRVPGEVHTPQPGT